MTGPLSGSNRPGEDDSWESLAEDLFGIDFHRGEANNLADDDEDDDFEPVTPPAAKEAVAVPSEEEDDEAGFPDEDESGFPEDDEEFVEAGFDDDEDDDDLADEKQVEPEPPSRRGAKPEPAAASFDEGDPFWDALNDWDWGDKTSPRKRPEPAPAVEEERPTESPLKDDEGGRGRRGRRRGRGGRSRTERGDRESSPRTEGSPRSEAAPRSEPPPRSQAPRSESGSRPPQPPRHEPPRPLSKLVDDFEFEPAPVESSGDDDAFGAGLLDSDSPRHREPSRSRPAARTDEGRDRPPSRRERSETIERPSERTPQPPSGRSPGSEEEPEGEDDQPRRRRRRRRRRSGEPAEAVEQDEAGFPEAGFPEGEADEPPVEPPRRRRERSDRSEPAAHGVADSRHAFRDVPTWAEAIALLVHRRPKQTTGWTPEPEEAEREGRPSRPPQRRRRRRSS